MITNPITKITTIGSLLILSACSSVPKPSDERDSTFLNDGYSILYQTVSGLRYSDDLLLVKSETDKVKAVEKDIADTASSMRTELEGLAESYPDIDITKNPLPEIEEKKRSAVNKDRLLSFAPGIGRSGAAFERTLLLSNSGALNQSQYLCKVMLEKEPNPQLRQFLTKCEKQFAHLYGEVVVLLNEEYFIHNNYNKKQ